MKRNLPDWENPNVQQINRERSRTDLIPFASERDALCGDRALASFFRLLNGTWDF